MRYLLFSLLLILMGCTKKEPSIMTIAENWQFRQVNDNQWENATVPGTVHTDLINNQKIKDPFYRLNEHELQWIDKTDWEYKTHFELPKETVERDYIEITFNGLDTYSKVYLNDTLLLKTDNMFRTYTVNVKEKVKLGENHLRVVFESPINRGIEKYDSVPYILPVSDNDLAEIGKVPDHKKVSIYTRKAGYHFGWDWGPRLVTSGIWRPIVIKSWNDFVIEDLFIRQKSLDSVAQLNAIIEINANEMEETDLEIAVDDISVLKQQLQLKKGLHVYEFPFTIANPERWWPNGMGQQKRYGVSVSIKGKKSRDAKSHKIGLRTVELITEKDSIGAAFYFKVNGQAVFMKGANYIPNDVFLPRVAKEDYERVVQSAVDANMNMLRVWGGGIYEEDQFYTLCDEKGILVWQDFMFACAMFPGDEDFLENVRHEAVDNVRRLRNHPSIALWCGNNEILSGWENWGWKQQMAATYSDAIADKVFKAYTDIFHMILPDAVAEHDPDRRYWSSSPSSSEGVAESLESGDKHYWGVWWGKEPFANFEVQIPRFMSEFGFQSFPELSTVEKYALPEDYDIYSEVMKSHQRSSIGNETIEEYMLRHYRKPKDFASYLYVSHLLQAHGVGEGIMAQRRNRAHCMGSLYWQINDCWPVASWSSTDYYGKWKALHYKVKKAFEPIVLSFGETKDSIGIFAVNDNLKGAASQLRLQLINFEGMVLKEWQKNVEVVANTSQKVMEIAKKDIEGFPASTTLLSAGLMDNDSLLAEQIAYRLPFSELQLQDPQLERSILEKENGFEVTLTTVNLAKDVYLTSRSLNNFTDNYFDLLPGETKTVFIEKDGTDLDFETDLQVFTLRDTY